MEFNINTIKNQNQILEEIEKVALETFESLKSENLTVFQFEMILKRLEELMRSNTRIS